MNTVSAYYLRRKTPPGLPSLDEVALQLARLGYCEFERAGALRETRGSGLVFGHGQRVDEAPVAPRVSRGIRA